MKERLLRILLVTGCLYATACTLNRETIIPGAEVKGEEVTVTFLLSSEDQPVGTRAAEDKPAYENRTISDGHLIDKVVYAVYVKVYDNTTLDENGKPRWTGDFRLLEQYGDGSDGLGAGQALLPLTGALRTEAGESLTLRMMRGQEYVIGFWAQCSDCKAYDTQNLESVIVDYKAEGGGLAPNNDETRDAFCQVYTFTAQVGVTEKVILKRALAQINIGTAGWDYNNEVDYGNSYAYSKIEMTGLNNKLNVLTGEVTSTEDFTGEVTYDWAMLPAYIGSDTYPQYPSEVEEDKDEFATWLKTKDNNKEFLYVKLLSGSSDYLDYLETSPEDDSKITTEIFKYLSMCYVLAPSATYTEDSASAGGFAMNELKFYLAEFVKEGEGYIYDDYAKTLELPASELFSIPDVPVQRNWRTNILGGTRGGADNSLFDPRSIPLYVDLSPSYDDDHYHYGNGNGNDDEDLESDEWTKTE